MFEDATARADQPGPDLSPLRWAFFGGEPLTLTLVSRLQQLAPAVRCVNFYGTTETPQAMSFFVVAGPNEARRAEVANAVQEA